MLFGPPAGLLPPEAENFELFALFWSDFTVQNQHFLKGFASSKKKFEMYYKKAHPLLFSVTEQGGGVLINWGFLKWNSADTKLLRLFQNVARASS